MYRLSQKHNLFGRLVLNKTPRYRWSGGSGLTIFQKFNMAKIILIQNRFTRQGNINFMVNAR